MAPSVKTSILSCEYYLEVKPVYGMFEKIKKTPIIKLPLMIVPSQVNHLETEAPEVEGWNPQEHPMVHIDMSRTDYAYSFCSHSDLDKDRKSVV